MPRSQRTLELNANAHRLGDEYYRHLKKVGWSDRGIDPECVTLARAYLDALETFRTHLSTLAHGEEVDVLMHTTEGHIELVNGDLERFETGGN
jgi:hypothetical protein